MPIPKFDQNGVLPPYLQDPTSVGDSSPYRATSFEVCERFGTTVARTNILSGWLRFRSLLVKAGMVHGFQHLDGSFLEDIETTGARDPRDLDLVTYYWNFGPEQHQRIIQLIPEIANRDEMKRVYLVDSYVVQADFSPMLAVELAQYWYGLFSHRRDLTWKGMIRVELATDDDDAAARLLLDSRRAAGGGA